MTVGNVLRRSSANFPNKFAIICGDKKITYSELNKKVNSLSNSIIDMGLKKGDRIALLLHNCQEFIELYFACAKSGTVVVPINNLLKQKELTQIFKYIRPRALFFDPDFRQLVRQSMPNEKSIEFAIELSSESSDFIHYDDLVAKGSVSEPDFTSKGEDLGSIFLTSGTTGRPKGAMRTHRHEWTNMMTSALEIGIRHDDCALLLFPFYHITFADSLRHILMANTIVIRKEGSFDPDQVLKLISDEKVSVCQFVPTMINAILQLEDVNKYDLSHFRLLIYAASPMPLELLKKALATFKCGFAQFYGQTETGPCTTVLLPEDHVLEGVGFNMQRLLSAGRPVVDFEVKIRGLNGKEMERGEVGEITVRSEAMTIGYWELPEETEKNIHDGWLYTGDYGKLDNDGYVYIVDRKHDMIISGGKNIYPREIEEVLYSNQAVLETAVVGVPDDYWGESVKAFVVLKKGMTTTESELIDLCKENLASYKKPRSVEFVKELPKSNTGKILKRLIRQQFGREIKP